MRWILGLSFIAMAAWTLVPDKYDDDEEQAAAPRFGVFGTTLVAFFLLEMGDKTQIATVALAARYDSLIGVVAGTTLGMMLANVPAVLLGEVAAKKLPMHIVHRIAAAIFLVLGVIGPARDSARSADSRRDLAGRVDAELGTQVFHDRTAFCGQPAHRRSACRQRRIRQQQHQSEVDEDRGPAGAEQQQHGNDAQHASRRAGSNVRAPGTRR